MFRFKSSSNPPLDQFAHTLTITTTETIRHRTLSCLRTIFININSSHRTLVKLIFTVLLKTNQIHCDFSFNINIIKQCYSMNDQFVTISQFLRNIKEYLLTLRIQLCTINYLRYQTFLNYYLQTYEVTLICIQPIDLLD